MPQIRFFAERREEVEEVLRSIGAGEIPQVRVYNKIDRSGQQAEVLFDESGKASRAFVSALDGQGVDALLDAVAEKLAGERVRRWIQLPGKDARTAGQPVRNGCRL